MCDSDKTKPGNGWRGWLDSRMQLRSVPAGAWIDLTWPLSPAVPRIASFPRPRIERIASILGPPLNISELQMVVHTGTHVDSPRHFFNDGPAFQNILLARLMGPGVVWRIDQPLYGLIEIDDRERMRPQLEPGDILAIDTGAAARVGTLDSDRHASLSVAAADWLVQQKVKLLAVDMPMPDVAIDLRRPAAAHRHGGGPGRGGQDPRAPGRAPPRGFSRAGPAVGRPRRRRPLPAVIRPSLGVGRSPCRPRLDCPAVAGARSPLMTGPAGDQRCAPRGALGASHPAVGARWSPSGLIMTDYVTGTRATDGATAARGR